MPLLGIALLLTLIDQMIKQAIKGNPVGDVIFCCPSLFELVHTVNQGAAMSMFSEHGRLLFLATSGMLVFLAGIICFYPGITNAARWSLCVLLGGGVGNWIDRLFGNGVTDYIRLLFIRFPVFNFADICISLSVTLLMILLLLNRLEQKVDQ